MTIESAAFIALLVYGFSLVSRRATETVVTPPLFFTLAGLVFGAGGLGWLELEIGSDTIRILAEATLIFVLFVDAAQIDLRALRREANLPARLLSIGMPLQIALGTQGAKLLLPNLTWWQCALLSSVLAPTDAALGQVVVTSPRVPKRLRQTLSVESGLNDGIALPLVMIFLATCVTLEQALPASHWVELVVRQLLFGALAGIVAGWLGEFLLTRACAKQWAGEAFRPIGVLAIALLAFAGAHWVEGNGFIAAFVAGLVFGWRSGDVHSQHLLELAEEEGQLLTLLTFLIFGAALLPQALNTITAPRLLYALLSLTVIRMVPVAIALIGSKVRSPGIRFLGWFGPRGLASILFALLIVEDSALENRDAIAETVFLTVLLSVVLHGVSAQYGARRIAKQVTATTSNARDSFHHRSE